MAGKKLAIIIVGYNSEDYLDDCLNSIFHSTISSYQVIFIDNGSSDHSLELLQKKYPAVTVIKNEANLGFAAANNLAVRRALDERYEYIFLLNPDTVVDHRCLAELTARLCPDTILQPLLLLHEGVKTNLINTTGNKLHYLGFSYVGNYRRDYRDVECPEGLAVASGAAMVVPAAIIKEIGLFDEDFFMYHEDVDFSWRSRQAGYQIKLVKRAKVWHKYSFSRNSEKFYYVELNRLRFLLKNYEAKTLILIAPILVLNELTVYGHALLNGYFGYKIKSLGNFIQTYLQTVSKRKKIIRRIEDRRLKAYLVADLDFFEIRLPLKSLYNAILRRYWMTVSRLI